MWKPGQSGNPKGRPPTGRAISDRLRAILNDEVPPPLLKKLSKEFGFELDPGTTFAEAIDLRVAIQSLYGEHTARDFVANRSEGTVANTLNLNSASANIPLNDEQKAKLAKALLASRSKPDGD